MCRFWLIGLAIGVVFMSVPRSPAGLYDPRQPTSPLVTERGVRPLPFDLFRDALNDLLALGSPLPATPPRPEALDLKKRTISRRDALLARGLGALSPTELAELGALQHRVRPIDASLDTLKQAYGRDPRNFWVLTHLGTVHQALGQLQEAAPYLETARDFFPEPWPGGNVNAGAWFKQAERYQLTLLRARVHEGVGRTGLRPGPAKDVDALFPVRFVGPSGQYEAGTITDAEKAKLPADAIAVVQQLLLWFPEDTRLVWLLGELYNAQGNLESASAVFEECVWTRRYDSPALREHRRIVRDALANQQAATAAPPAPEKPKESLRPDNSTLWTVGAISGTVLVALGWWQVREIMRRFRATSRPST
jgi:tetratricopeptide (TPR) repeat protein